MASLKHGRQPRPTSGRGLLTEDRSEIKLVPASEREWWSRLSDAAKAKFAALHGKKWSDEETQRLVLADPDNTDYYGLAAEMGRSPGALRARRSQMIHILKDEYGYPAKARAYFEDKRTNHRLADIGQVYRVLKELGILESPVHQQFTMARHLRQPTTSWRGDNSGAVLRERRAQARNLKATLARLRVQRAGAPNSELGA
jgi:hypothetical protein